MNPSTLQLVNTIVAALIIASIIGIAKWITGKADKAAIAELKTEIARLEVKFDAGLLIIGASITRPELAEKMLAITGRMDDRMARVLADIVQLNADMKANSKSIADTDKKLDDLPSRVRGLEDRKSN